MKCRIFVLSGIPYLKLSHVHIPMDQVIEINTHAGADGMSAEVKTAGGKVHSVGPETAGELRKLLESMPDYKDWLDDDDDDDDDDDHFPVMPVPVGGFSHN
jgi:hypothetical protein